MKLENLEQANKIAGQIKALDGKIADVERLHFSEEQMPPLTISDGNGYSVWLTSDEIGSEVQKTVQSGLLEALYDTRSELAEKLEKL